MDQGQDTDAKAHGNGKDLSNSAARLFPGLGGAGADNRQRPTEDQEGRRHKFHHGIANDSSEGFKGSFRRDARGNEGHDRLEPPIQY